MNSPSNRSEENPLMTIEKLEALWRKALESRNQQHIEEYVGDGVMDFITSLGLLQNVGLISTDGESGSWLTRTLEIGLDNWLREKDWTIEQARELGLDIDSIKKLTEGMGIDTLIRENKKKIGKILPK